MSVNHAARTNSTFALLARFRDFGIFSIAILVGLSFALINPNFLRPDNLSAIVLSISIMLVLAIGQMFVIIARQIDLSIGSTLGISAMTVGMLSRDFPGISFSILLLAGIGAGLLAGVVNGLLVTVAGAPAIIVTLGTLAIYRGVIFIMSGNTQVNPFDISPSISSLVKAGPTTVLSPIVLIAVLVAIIGWYFSERTMSGLRLYAIGSNPDAADARGLGTKRAQFLVFVVMGGLAGLAGILYVARFGTVNPADVGFGWELTVISAVVIGGTNIFGGSGSVAGVVLGTLLVGSLANGLTVVGVSGFWQQAASGAIILLAVAIDTVVRRKLTSSSGS